MTNSKGPGMVSRDLDFLRDFHYPRALVVSEDLAMRGSLAKSLGHWKVEYDFAAGKEEAIVLMSQPDCCYPLVLIDACEGKQNGEDLIERVAEVAEIENTFWMIITSDESESIPMEYAGACGIRLGWGHEEGACEIVFTEKLHEIIAQYCSLQLHGCDQKSRCAPSIYKHDFGISDVDYIALIQLSTGDESFLQRLMQQAAKDLTQRVDVIQDAVINNDSDVVSNELHTIKGMMANLGVEILQQQALELEQGLNQCEIVSLRKELNIFCNNCVSFVLMTRELDWQFLISQTGQT